MYFFDRDVFKILQAVKNCADRSLVRTNNRGCLRDIDLSIVPSQKIQLAVL